MLMRGDIQEYSQIVQSYFPCLHPITHFPPIGNMPDTSKFIFFTQMDKFLLFQFFLSVAHLGAQLHPCVVKYPCFLHFWKYLIIFSCGLLRSMHLLYHCKKAKSSKHLTYNPYIQLYPIPIDQTDLTNNLQNNLFSLKVQTIRRFHN